MSLSTDTTDRGRVLADEIQGYVAEHDVGALGNDDPAWRAMVDEIAGLRPSRFSIVGRPAFLTDRWFERLVAEARALRAGSRPTGSHKSQAGQRIATPGPAGTTFVRHRGWRELLWETLAFEPQPPYHVSYLYYDTAGAYIAPHVDDPDFAVNILVVLERSPLGDAGSATVLHPPGREPVRAVLQPGEAVVLEAEGLVHSREPVCEGETVTVMTIGYARPGYSPITA
jgi:hypothetical protein